MAQVILPARRKDDPLTTIMKGLQIASNIYGIKTNIAQLEDFKIKREQETKETKFKESERTRLREGKFTKPELLGFSKDFESSETPSLGSFKVSEVGSDKPLYLMVRKDKEAGIKIDTEEGGQKTTLLVDPKTGKAIAKFKAPTDKVGKIKIADDLRRQWLSNPETKTTQLVSVAAGKIRDIGTSDPSAAGDMSLIFNYVKLLDPGSTVREGEFATAENTAGIPEQIRRSYNKALTGERLGDKQREDFVSRAEDLWTVHLSRQKRLDAEFRRLADEGGIDPSSVVLDLGFESLNVRKPNTSQKEALSAFADLKARAESGDRDAILYLNELLKLGAGP